MIEAPTYAVHPLIGLFPRLVDDELEQLAVDTKVQGQQQAIVLCDGVIVAGYYQMEACELAGVPPVLMHWNTSDSLALFVLRMGVKDRSLTSGQRAAIAVLSMPYFIAEGQILYRRDAMPVLAEALGVNLSQVARALLMQNQFPAAFNNLIAGTATAGEYDRLRTAARAALKPVVLSDSTEAEGTVKYDRTKGARVRRQARIRELAASGHRAAQIAIEIGVTEERVGILARSGDIELPDSFLSASRKLDPNRIVRETVVSAAALTTGLDLVDGSLDQLDVEVIPDWLRSLNQSISALTRLHKQLRGVNRGQQTTESCT